jgi:hypothetical protein
VNCMMLSWLAYAIQAEDDFLDKTVKIPGDIHCINLPCPSRLTKPKVLSSQFQKSTPSICSYSGFLLGVLLNIRA